MNNPIIPTPDTIPVAWGWFQALLLLIFPLHLLFMNTLIGGLAISVVLRFKHGELNKKLSHLIAIGLPVVIAFTVNLGVATLLFLQVLYGHLIYTSSILMGALWVFVIPIIILGYYGAYLYDFRFHKLGLWGIVIAIICLVLFLTVAYLFTNNMIFMSLPHLFSQYFEHISGDMLVSDHPMFLPRFLHMITGALAIGGLMVAVLGSFTARDDHALADHAKRIGLRTFFWLTILNIFIGTWFLFAIPGHITWHFLGSEPFPTLLFVVAMALLITVLILGSKKKVGLTAIFSMALVYVMSFMRAYLRDDLLANIFSPGQLEVTGQYSPLVFFLATLIFGILCIAWMVKKTRQLLT